MKKFIVALFAVLTMACAPHAPVALENIAPESSIINGTPVTERKTRAAQSVVLIEALDNRNRLIGLCTGTLISTHAVLTAAHCLDRGLMPSLRTFNLVFTENYSPGKALVRRAGGRFFLHPRYNSTGTHDHDIAVGFFAGEIPSRYYWVRFDTDQRADYSGQSVYVYGYGRTRDWRENEPPSLAIGRLHRAEMKVDDNYPRQTDRYRTSSESRSYICNGDSGGPQFYHERGVLKIIGINSATIVTRRGSKTCLGVAQATKVANASPWINKILKTYSPKITHSASLKAERSH